MKTKNRNKYKKIIDNRGYFAKLLSQEKNRFFLKKEIAEINLSFNKKKGTIRGLHYQIGAYKEKKLIYCLKGKAYDIMVNINKKSNLYKKKFVNIIDSKKNNFLFIPENYAHGFQTLEKDTTLLYLHSKKYSKRFERSINPFDEEISIKWPIKNITISKKDNK